MLGSPGAQLTCVLPTQLPYLIDGSHKITQSNAILRYIARKHNLCEWGCPWGWGAVAVPLGLGGPGC